MTVPPDPAARLASVALGQHHCFTFRDAIDAGYSPAQVRRARGRTWRALGVGVFVDAVVWEGLSLEQQHLCATHARVLELGPGWHAARRSAALAWGLPLLGSPPSRPLLVRDKNRWSDRGRNRFERRNTVPEQERAVVAGLPVETMARLVVDQAREESFLSAFVTADAAVLRGLDRGDLSATARRCVEWPNGLQGLRVSRSVTGRAQTPIESLSVARMIMLGIPLPEQQVGVWVEDRLLAVVDFLWRFCNLVGEANGASKYLLYPGRAEVEKVREASLRAVGLEVANWGWESAYSPKGDLEEVLRTGMQLGSRSVLDPRVRFVPVSDAEIRRLSS